MEKGSGNNKLLLVGGARELAEIVRQVVADTYQVTHAESGAEGLERARKEIPAIIVLGSLDPPGATFDLHNKLRGGWITRNIPLLVVDYKTPENPRGALSMEEGLQIEADEYISVSAADGAASATRLAEPIKRLREKLEGRIQETANRLRAALLDPERFAITWEQVPGRGAFEISQEEIIDGTLIAAQGGIVDAISVTDNPGGNPSINTEILGYEIKKAGVEPLIHIACRDKNRNQIESQLFSLAAGGIRNVLLARQEKRGSWNDTICREYGTAMALIILQMPNSYLPIFQR